MNFKQATEIDISFIHNIEATCFIWNDIKDIDIVDTCFGDVQKARYRSLYIIQRVKFDSAFVFSKFSPPENAQTQVNGCGILCVHIPINLYFKIASITAFTGFINQDVGKLFKDFIAALFVCFPKIPAGNSLTKSKMVIFGLVVLAP